MRDLIGKIDKLMLEAQVKPGERKRISFTYNKLDKLKLQIRKYEASLYKVQDASENMPDEIKKDLLQVQEKINTALKTIEVQQAELLKTIDGQSETPIKMNALFKGIKKNCGQILKIYKELNNEDFSSEVYLYRGIRENSDALYGKPFDVRRPKDSNEDMDQLLDEAMKSVNIEARRSNSIFVTGNRSQASGYGHNIYIVFPVDGFDITYSKRERDLIVGKDHIKYFLDDDVKASVLDAIRDAYEQAGEGSEFHSRFPKYNIDELFTYDYDFHAYVSQIRSMAKLGFIPEELVKLAEDELMTNLEKALEHFNFVDDDAFAAIRSGHEAYVRGAYYAVKIDHIENVNKILADIDTSDVELPEKYGEPPEFIIFKGDIVKIIKGMDEGKVATVKEVAADNALSLSTQYGEPNIYSVPATHVEKIKDTENYLGTNTKSGTKVIVNNENSPFYGYTGEVSGTYSVEVTVTFEEPSARADFYISELLHATEENIEKLSSKKKPIPKTGDKVIVIDDSDPFYNLVGRITYVYDNKTKADINFETGEISKTYKVAKLESFDETKHTPKKDITIGNIVIVNRSSSTYDGKKAIVKNIYSDGDIRLTLVDSGKGITLPLDYIEFEAEGDPIIPLSKQFKVGDKIQILSGTFSGKEATIVQIDSSDDTARVEFPDNDTLWVGLNAIEIVSDKIKVGDHVEVIDGPSLGETGKVAELFTSAYGEASAKIIISTGGAKVFHVVHLKKVSNPASSSGTTGLSKGDLVQVVDENSGYYMAIGKIIDFPIGYSKQAVTIMLLGGETPGSVYTDQVELVIDGSTYSSLTKEDLELGRYYKVIDPLSPFYNQIGRATYIYSSAPEVSLQFGDGETEKDVFFHQVIKASSSDIGDGMFNGFKVGDTVKITDGGLYDGDVAKIYAIEKDELWPIKVEFNKDMVSSYKPNEIEKIDASPDSTTKFVTGDSVEIITPNSTFNGETGVVKSFDQKSGNYEVSFSNIGDQLLTFKEFEMKKVEPETEFSLGDKVTIDNLGVTGIITGIKGEAITVETPDNDMFGVFANEITKVGDSQPSEPASSEKTPGLKVGDKVKIISTNSFYQGKIGKVVDTINQGSLIVNLDGSDQNYAYLTSELEKVDDTVKLKYKVGDKVKLVGSGHVGHITDIEPQKSYPYTMKFLNGNEGAVKDEEITLYTEKPKTTEKKFSAGDYVIIQDPTHVYNGEILTVQYGGHFFSDLVSEVDGIITVDNDSLTKTDPPKAETPAPSFAAGDKVKVINSKLLPPYADHDIFADKIFTIIDIGSSYIEAKNDEGSIFYFDTGDIEKVP
jgi:transcription antitermination factor NusG